VKALWWWEALREPVTFRQHADPIGIVEKIMPGDEAVWLVAEAAENKAEGNFWLYEGTVASVCAVLRECPAFEYYVVERAMNWLLCENHHGFLIASGQPATARLAAETME